MFEICAYIALTAAVLSIPFFMNNAYRPGVEKRAAAAPLGLACVSAAAYIPLAFVNLQYVAWFLFLVPTAAFVVRHVFIPVYANKRDDASFTLSVAIFCTLCGTGSVDILGQAGAFSADTAGYVLFGMLAVVLLFSSVYVVFILRTEFKAQKADRYRHRIEALQSEILREQITPHFIFNTLNTIQALYHESTAAGDRAMGLFSAHLRANVDAAGADRIPFEQELRIIQNYVDLENLKHAQAFNVVFDIDCADFDVPVLALQPFVENAIKHSKVNATDDGAIVISTYETDGAITIEIADNGVGFDPAAVRKTACGIRNATERFQLLLGASVTVRSAAGLGTHITVLIPAAKEDCA